MKSSHSAVMGFVLAALTIFAVTPMLAQESGGYMITGPCFHPVTNRSGICPENLIPQQRAELQERERKERDRLARDRLEQEATQAEIRRKVDAQLAKMGGNPARRAEAERFVGMQEEAERARAKLPRPRPKTCTSRTWDQATSIAGSTRDFAFAALTTSVSRRQGCTIGGSETLTSVRFATAANCSERVVPYLDAPKVGTCLACISEELAIRFGYVPGKGWPPPETEWVCTATLACAAQKCGDSAGSKVSEQ
ncbi:MAG: hypothetical protein O9286_14465 [Aquidulcibacter sp.]|uniref:hypothetical protein n=1 Tax=Aquidulcibacter sp. TaxID=2052990 RepID=UPI0022C33EF1|nr:hypothetical protein [Aquidulcibacter sp.]